MNDSIPRNLTASDLRAGTKVQKMIYGLLGLVPAEGQCFVADNPTAVLFKTSGVQLSVLWLLISKAGERKQNNHHHETEKINNDMFTK